MRSAWAGIVVTPSLVLADQSVAYALVQRSCARQDLTTMHLVHIVFLAAVLVILALAAAERRRFVPNVREDAGDRATYGSMLGTMAVLIAALSALVIVALWAPQWILSPCHS